MKTPTQASALRAGSTIWRWRAPASLAKQRAGHHHIEPALLEGIKRAFDLAEARPDLLRQPAP